MRIRDAVASIALAGMLGMTMAVPASAVTGPRLAAVQVQAEGFPALQYITLTADGTGGCVELNYPNTLKVALGSELGITNEYGKTATVTEEAGFWKFTLQNNTSVSPKMNHAGQYGFSCSGPPNWDPVWVRMSGPSSASGSFTVKWANSKSASSYTYTVQYKITSSGSIKTWKKGTSERSATFNPKHHNTYYYFRAETIRTSTAKSGWSPWKKVHVT